MIDVRTARSPGGMTWQVSRATVPSPPDVPRIRKAAGESAGLAVAIPLHEGAGDEVAGRVHVGLPVTELGLPLRVGAQFAPNPSRQHLNDTPWNQALLPLLADLWAAVMLRQLRWTRPRPGGGCPCRTTSGRPNAADPRHAG